MQIETDRNKVVYSDARRIVSQLVRWHEEGNSGNMAILERGNAYPLIFPLINNTYNRNHAEDVGLLVGQCFGILRHHSDMGRFGSSMRIFQFKISNGGTNNGLKTRANRIIMSDGLQSIEAVLLSMIKWMKPYSIPVDFWRLYVDLYFWGEKTKRRWASEFYSGGEC